MLKSELVGSKFDLAEVTLAEGFGNDIVFEGLIVLRVI
jgi:hypothetical protein